MIGRNWVGQRFGEGDCIGGWWKGPLGPVGRWERQARGAVCLGWAGHRGKVSQAWQTPGVLAGVPSPAPDGGSSPQRHWTAPAPADAAASRPRAPSLHPALAAWTAPVPTPPPLLSEHAANVIQATTSFNYWRIVLSSVGALCIYVYVPCCQQACLWYRQSTVTVPILVQHWLM